MRDPEVSSILKVNSLAWYIFCGCLQEALFQLQLQQAEAGAKHCTGLVGSQGQVLGQDPPSPSTVKRLKAARQAALDQHERDTQEAATHRCVAIAGVYNMDA
jgi:hypothetical protein